MSGGGTRAGVAPVVPGGGRRVEVLTAGSADGLAVVFRHGTPFDRHFDDEGHISSAVDAYGRILDDLLALADGARS